MADAEVDLVTRYSDLVVDDIAARAEPIGDFGLKVAVGLRSPSGLAATLPCVSAYSRYFRSTWTPSALSGVGLISGRSERAEKADTRARARKQDVQSSVSLLAVDRSEALLEDDRAWFGAVSHRYEDEVAFVALDVLQILDEQILALVRDLFAVLFDQHIIRDQPVQFLLDQVALLDVQRHDAERRDLAFIMGSVVPHEGDRLFGHAARFHGVAPSLECSGTRTRSIEKDAGFEAGKVMSSRP